MSSELEPYTVVKPSYSSRPSLIAQPLANRSTGGYKIYDVGLGFAEMFCRKYVE